ncbi:MAG TPA: AraC family transcriptional regulator [Lachnospiraceae bacterium]|nr:AraC family transcriptional regulator [Lachnospiraceae bacterium]
MNYSFEVVKYDRNIPGRILLQDKPGWRCNTTLHWHKELELVYMVKGCLNVKINGREVKVKENEFYLCNSEEIHITSVEKLSENYTYIVVLLSYEYMREFCRKIDSYIFEVVEGSMAYDDIKVQLKQLLALTKSSDVYVTIQQNRAILEIYHILLTRCCKYRSNSFLPSTPPNFAYAKQIIEYVCKNYKEKITLEDMAAMIGFSPQYLAKYFRKITESSFVQYLNKIRLEHALQDMLNRNYSVTNAAFENGFTNVKSYISTCRKVYGVTPTQYKRLNTIDFN